MAAYGKPGRTRTVGHKQPTVRAIMWTFEWLLRIRQWTFRPSMTGGALSTSTVLPDTHVHSRPCIRFSQYRLDIMQKRGMPRHTVRNCPSASSGLRQQDGVRRSPCCAPFKFAHQSGPSFQPCANVSTGPVVQRLARTGSFIAISMFEMSRYPGNC